MSKTAERPFRRLAVIGAGNMGSGIAQKMATEGFPVVLVDLDDEKVARGVANIEKTLAQGVERKIFTPEQASRIRGRIEGTTDWSRLSDVDLVVEAVFEDRDVKRKVFERLEENCPDPAVLATNTSSFSVTDLASGMKRPERMLGLHYFYHPAKNRLVEVVPGERTGAGVVERAWSLQERMGKTPIASADRSGFVVNRFFVPWLNEAVRLLEEGIADVASIEAAAKNAFRVGMGPFELMNVTGVPIAFHAATTLGEAFGPFYAPAELLRKQVEAGKPWDLAGAPDPSKERQVADRMMAATFLAATALVEEGVGTLEDTDIGARVGLRWPRGPFQIMNRVGVKRARELVEPLASRWKMDVPSLLAEHARKGVPFSFRLVRSSVRDGIATLTINRPDAMNALNEEVVAQLHEAFRSAAADPGVRGIVIAGSGKAFVAGADIRFFVRNIELKTFDRIVEFTRKGHDLLSDIASCPKPVVARMHGLALGGGLELALACRAIFASDRAVMAFPETGIGIYPGLGGTQRARRRIGTGLAKWLIFTGEMVGAGDAAAIGLVDRVLPHEELDDAIRVHIEAGAPPIERPQVPARFRELDEFFSEHPADEIREGKADPGDSRVVARAVKKVARKAPIALRLAERLIREGEDLPLEDGLKLELDHLEEIFRTRDAHEGLSSLGRRAPAFEGR